MDSWIHHFSIELQRLLSAMNDPRKTLVVRFQLLDRDCAVLMTTRTRVSFEKCSQKIPGNMCRSVKSFSVVG